MLHRREFIYTSLLLAAGSASGMSRRPDYSVLVQDATGVLDLPKDFSYKVIARSGDAMNDGLVRPARPDGMGAFAAADGNVAIVCNHENIASQNNFGAFGNELEKLNDVPAEHIYDRGQGLYPGMGGTTTMVYKPSSQAVIHQNLSLAGTELNCAGGMTPWGTWLSCEEFGFGIGERTAKIPREKTHGFVFEVDPLATTLQAPKRLSALGQFSHEAAAIDPETGVVYLTEDDHNGLFYRMIPNKPGDLTAGGRLQALVLEGSQRGDSSNWEGTDITLGQWQNVTWIDVPATPENGKDIKDIGREKGATRFVRGEGIWYQNGEFCFTCTEGGPAHLGQVYRYRPDGKDAGKLMLLVESSADSAFQKPDNICFTPWDEMLVCEDKDGHCGMFRVNKKGAIFPFALHRDTKSELTGACFAPDGKTLFVNVQTEGLTLAITGPFNHL